MTDDTGGKPPKRSLFRKILLVLGIGIGLLLLVNILFPDLDPTSTYRWKIGWR
jgi:hypothetical protein